MPIASPCNKVCTVDPRTKLCHGCGRTISEIGGWMSLTDAERERIMAELPQRMRQNGLRAPVAAQER